MNKKTGVLSNREKKKKRQTERCKTKRARKFTAIYLRETKLKKKNYFYQKINCNKCGEVYNKLFLALTGHHLYPLDVFNRYINIKKYNLFIWTVAHILHYVSPASLIIFCMSWVGHKSAPDGKAFPG